MLDNEQRLIDGATKARTRAYAPYSNFQVGAAVETESGDFYTGCNIESASYGLTVCAERVAIWNAISQGKRRIKRIAVVADTEELTPPCGACRQIIWEFGGDIPVILANSKGQTDTLQMKDLLPLAFDTKFLK